jgi:hypothetical protein
MADKELNLKMVVDNAQAQHAADALNQKLDQVDKKLDAIEADGRQAGNAVKQGAEEAQRANEALNQKLDQVDKKLDAIEADGRRAGRGVKEGADNATKGLQTTVGVASQLHQGLLAVQAGGMALGAVRSVLDPISAQMKEVAEFTKRTAAEFQNVQQGMQGVAALKGKANTDNFTVEEARKGAAASLRPEEWKGFQESFQSYGGAFIEGDQSRFTGQAGMTGEEQAEKYQQDIAKFALARKVAPGEAAQLAGGLLQFSEGPQKVEDVEAKFGKVFKTLERAPTPVQALLPQMSRVMAQGASPEDASKLLALMSEAMPGEEETGVTNALKAITNQTLEGKGEALGQKEGMSPLEKIKAAVTTIKGRVDKGENLDRILHEVAPDIRESRGLKGFLTRGLEAGGFDRVEGYQRDTPDDFIKQELTSYDKSEGGADRKRDANFALAEIEQGQKFADVERLKKEAKTQLTKEGRFDKPTGLDFARGEFKHWLGKIVTVDTTVNDDLVNQRAYELAEKETDVPASKRLGLAPGANQAVADDAIRQLMPKRGRRPALDGLATDLPERGRRPALEGLEGGAAGGQPDGGHRDLLQQQIQLQREHLQFARQQGRQAAPEPSPPVSFPTPLVVPPMADRGARH